MASFRLRQVVVVPSTGNLVYEKRLKIFCALLLRAIGKFDVGKTDC